jgi:hypothetical protein
MQHCFVPAGMKIIMLRVDASRLRRDSRVEAIQLIDVPRPRALLACHWPWRERETERERERERETERFITGVVDLLKRHSGIVWHSGQFAGLLRGEDVRRSGNPSSPPLFLEGVPVQAHLPQPHDLWQCLGPPTNIPPGQSPSRHYVISYASDPSVY